MSTERFVVYLISSTIVLVNINCAVIKKKSPELFQESTVLVFFIEELISRFYVFFCKRIFGISFESVVALIVYNSIVLQPISLIYLCFDSPKLKRLGRNSQTGMFKNILTLHLQSIRARHVFFWIYGIMI